MPNLVPDLAELTAHKAFTRFINGLSRLLYDLEPTDNIAEVIFDHVDNFLAFYNVEKGQRITYMWGCQAFGRWFICLPPAPVRETNKLWIAAFEKATPTCGYAQIHRTREGWSMR